MFLFQVSGAVSPPEKLRAFAFLWDLPDGVAIVILGIDDALGIVIITSVKISVPSTVKSPLNRALRAEWQWWIMVELNFVEGRSQICPKLEKCCLLLA